MQILPSGVQPPLGPSHGLAEPFGEPQLLQLANGARVTSLDLPQAPLVCLDFWCRAGSASERSGELGMAHFLEHMVFKGSRRLGPGEFDRRVEALGGSSNAATGFDDVHFHVLIPPESAAAALDLLLDLVLAPRLDAAEFHLERQVVLEELAQSEDQPEEQALQALLAQACPGHAYGLPILGSRDSLEAMDPAAMASFHGRLYRGGRCCLGISGPLAGLDLEQRAADGPLASLPPCRNGEGASEEQGMAAALEFAGGEGRLSLPRLESARLLMAWPLAPAVDLAMVAGADLATTILAEGRRSRLVQRLREDLRLVESIDLDLHVLEAGSLALLEAVCAAEDLPRVRQAITAVWAELAEVPLGAGEWRRAQRLVSNGYRFGLEAAAGLAALIGSNGLWQRPLRLAAPLEAIQRWQPEALGERLWPLLNPARSALLEVVPA